MQRIDQAAVQEWLRDLFYWREKRSGTIAPDERLPWGETTAMGIQHVLAMFGATVLAPIIMGFDTNVAIFFSAIGTLLFFFITGGQIPSYLGSSFAFIAPVIAVTGGVAGSADIPKALGGIVVCGIVYTLIGFVVHLSGSEWIDALMPPIVTGAVVAIIGLNLAGVAWGNASENMTLAIITILAILLIATIGTGMIGRLAILLGTVVGYVFALIVGGTSAAGRELGPWHINGVDFQAVRDASWIGLPDFTTPSFDGNAILLVAPVAIILVAENTGHIKAVSEMTNRNLMPYLGRGFIGDGVATTVAGLGGGPGVTTYAENIGVMAVTRVFSTAMFVIAAGVAFVLSMSPKFGALVGSIPLGVLGGVATVLFGLIAVAGIRIWVDNRVDFSKAVNLFIAAVVLIVGTADYTIQLGDFMLNGIALGTFGAIILYQIFRLVPGAVDDDPSASPASAPFEEDYEFAMEGGPRPRQRSAPERRMRRDPRGEQRARRDVIEDDWTGVDMDDPEMMRPRQQPPARERRPQRRPAPPREDFGFEEPMETPEPPRQPRGGAQRPPQGGRRRVQEPEFDDIVLDEPAAIRPGTRPADDPRRAPQAPEGGDEFGFDEPMPLPRAPQPPRQQRRPRQQPRRDEGPEGDTPPPRRRPRERQ